MNPQLFIPNFISSMRVATLPIFLVLFSLQNIAACLILLAFSAATDYFDGYYARKLEATSKFGAYFDATSDFALTAGIFTLFTINGTYPIWLILLIVAHFGQFVITSIFAKKLYDPIGRYMGSALYIGIVLTLLVPAQAIYLFVEYAFLVFFLASLSSRIISLSRKSAN
ncbi:MAG: CDP-alcohol phosphatidyltransferase family protein [Candidatus Bathyarchaeia archaeon]